MDARIQLLIVVDIAIYLIPASCTDLGTASYYSRPYTPSACYGFNDSGVWIAAASDKFWSNGKACGQSYEIICNGATNQGMQNPCTSFTNPGVAGVALVVTIVDYCRDCNGATINLSEDAFALIANINAGNIEVFYRRVQ